MGCTCQSEWNVGSDVANHLGQILLRLVEPGNVSTLSYIRCRALARPPRPPLSLDIQVQRPDQLEERIILGFHVPFLVPVVSPYQLAYEDLYFKQSEVEANAHPLPSSETRLLKRSF